MPITDPDPMAERLMAMCRDSMSTMRTHTPNPEEQALE